MFSFLMCLISHYILLVICSCFSFFLAHNELFSSFLEQQLLVADCHQLFPGSVHFYTAWRHLSNFCAEDYAVELSSNTDKCVKRQRCIYIHIHTVMIQGKHQDVKKRQHLGTCIWLVMCFRVFFRFVLRGRNFCWLLRSQLDIFFPLGAYSVQYCLKGYGACQRLGLQHHCMRTALKQLGDKDEAAEKMLYHLPRCRETFLLFTISLN